MLEHRRGVAQAIWHLEELINPHTADGKAGVLPGRLCHFHLPEVHARKVPGTYHAFHGLLHSWQGIGILLSSGRIYANLSNPSFFFTSTMVLHHSDCEGWMAPPSNISWMCWQTSSTKGGAMCLNHSLNSLSFRSSMMCSVVFLSYLRGPILEAIQPTILFQGSEEDLLSLLNTQLGCHRSLGVLLV